MKNFNHMVSTNMIPNFPIPVADISNAAEIYEPYIACLKVKSTRSKPRLLIKHDIQIPIKIYKKNQFFVMN